MNTTPYWIESGLLPEFPRLDGDRSADVVVVGGGITGVTAAYLLARAGCRVVLLERERCASLDTGHTTAHRTNDGMPLSAAPARTHCICYTDVTSGLASKWMVSQVPAKQQAHRRPTPQPLRLALAASNGIA